MHINLFSPSWSELLDGFVVLMLLSANLAIFVMLVPYMQALIQYVRKYVKDFFGSWGMMDQFVKLKQDQALEQSPNYRQNLN